MVALAYACSQIRTMMVMHRNTAIAHPAMENSRRLNYEASWAPFAQDFVFCRFLLYVVDWVRHTRHLQLALFVKTRMSASYAFVENNTQGILVVI